MSRTTTAPQSTRSMIAAHCTVQQTRMSSLRTLAPVGLLAHQCLLGTFFVQINTVAHPRCTQWIRQRRHQTPTGRAQAQQIEWKLTTECVAHTRNKLVALGAQRQRRAGRGRYPSPPVRPGPAPLPHQYGRRDGTALSLPSAWRAGVSPHNAYARV